MILPTDPEVNRAFERALGHTGPFTAEECTAYTGTLTILHARDIGDLVSLPNITRLELYASTLASVDAIASLQHLKHLRFACTDVRDMQPLARCTALQTLACVFTLIEDVRPILTLPDITTIEVVGSPLSDACYAHLQELQASQNILVGLSSVADWKLSQKLANKHIRASYSFYQGNSWFVRPGIPRLLRANCDFTMTPRFIIEQMLTDSQFAAETIFTAMGLGERTEQSPYHLFDFAGHYTIGYRAHAQRWIADATFSEQEKIQLRQFIDAFHTLLFFREDDALLDTIETRYGAKLPEWFREQRKTLAYALPYNAVTCQFSHARLPSLGDEDTDQWYELRLRGIDHQQQRPIIDHHGLFGVGARLPDAEHVLAINLQHPADHAVYRYRTDAMTENGMLAPEGIVSIVSLYTELLTSISSLRTEHTQIDATTDRSAP